MIIKKYFNSIIVLFFFNCTFASQEEKPSETLAKFKIGLEFQEGSRLVSGRPLEEVRPIHMYNPQVQKKTIFTIDG